MGDEDRRLAGALVDVAQPAPQVLAHLGVEGPERLVEEEHPRLDRERAGERHALALAAGELGRKAPLEPVELDEVEERRAPARRISASDGPPRRAARARRP